MSVARVLSAEGAAALVPDRAVVAISSSSGLNTPERVLRAIGERFEREGRPRGLTTLHPIGTGDMYGIKGIDHLARPVRVSTPPRFAATSRSMSKIRPLGRL